MARRGRKRKQHRRSRRRVGAISTKSKDTAVKLLSVAAGIFLAGDAINTAFDKFLPKTKDPVTNVESISTATNNITAVGEVGIGGLFLLKRTAGGTAGLIIKAAGGVLAGAGIRRALKGMGVIKGYQAVPVIGRHRMAGYQNTPVIGASVVPPQLAGRTPAQLQGYKVSGYVPHGSGAVMAGVDAGSGSGIITNSGSGYMN